MDTENQNIKKTVVDGITIIEGEKIDESKQIEVTEELCKGIPKSGKPWKKFSARNSSHIRVNKGLCKTWEEKQKIKQKKDELKEMIKQIKEVNDEKYKQEAQRIKDKKKRKELNDFQSGQFQLIKNTKKINKWGKKARQTLQKIPYELYDKIIKKEYGY